MSFVAKHITSMHNPLFKIAVRLRESASFRKKNNLIVFEGIKEFQLSLKSSFVPHRVFCHDSISENMQELILSSTDCLRLELISCPMTLFRKLALRDDPDNIVCIGQFSSLQFSQMKSTRKTPIYLVLQGVEKPGNIGAIFRTADALGLDGIIVMQETSDILSPNAIRSSLGTVFTVPWAYTCQSDLSLFMKSNSIHAVAAYLDPESTPLHSVNFNKPLAIFLGSEALGLPPEILEIVDECMMIPMCGAVDSLNVSVATAIIAYEACRQQERL